MRNDHNEPLEPVTAFGTKQQKDCLISGTDVLHTDGHEGVHQRPLEKGSVFKRHETPTLEGLLRASRVAGCRCPYSETRLGRRQNIIEVC